MNWMSKTSDARRWAEDGRSDLCEHVERDRTLAYTVYREDDSFGPVGRYVACKKCADKADEEEAASIYRCDDCGRDVQRRAGRMWRWYDFYAPQGDEPLFICNQCESGPVHTARKRRDREEEQREYPQDFPDDDDFGLICTLCDTYDQMPGYDVCMSCLDEFTLPRGKASGGDGGAR